MTTYCALHLRTTEIRSLRFSAKPECAYMHKYCVMVVDDFVAHARVL